MSSALPSIPGIFVVGTDTGVGKTRVAAALARTWMLGGHRVGVVKPASTGATRSAEGSLRSSDVAALVAAIAAEGSPFPPPPLDRVGPLVYEEPLAPPVAARRTGVPLDPATLERATDDALAWWHDVAGASLVVVEGVGGLLCPLAEGGYTVADLAQHLDYPLLIVTRRGLGTLNHTLLTVEAARSRGLRVAGIILNAARPADAPAPLDPDPAETSNAEELARLLPGLAILADYPHGPDQPPVPIAPEAGHWLDLALPPRRLAIAGTTPAASLAPIVAPTTASGDPLLPGSVLDDPGPSGDDFAPATADLLGSSTGSGEPVAASVPIAEPTAASSSSSAFPALDLRLKTDPSPPSAPIGAATPPLASSPGASAVGSYEEDGDEDAPSPWRSVLLTSYASAVTLALGWTLYTHRADRQSAPTSVEVDAPDPAHGTGRLGDRSRTLTPLEPVTRDHLVAIGQKLTVGSLVVDPVAVNRQDVTLERTGLTGKAESKAGGRRVLALRVQLLNTSKDEVFAPVDPAFVRPDAQDQSETLLELDDGRKFYTYPLAVESEWGLVGQGFGDLRPGESREVLFATTPDVPAGVERAPGTWRLKLRTDVGATAVVGVRLNAPPEKAK